MRNRVIEGLRHAPDGLGVKELARRLDLHPNSVRWHLGSLEHEGLLSSAPEPSTRRGRPQLIYRLRAAALEGTRDEYRLLATILSGAVAATGGAAAAEECGRAWGRYLVPRPLPLVRRSAEQATQAVVALLDEQGFAPEISGGEIRIHRCPFHDLAESEPEIVCAVHRGLIEGAFEELGADVELDGLEAFAEPELCVARVSPKASRRRTAPTAGRLTA